MDRLAQLIGKLKEQFEQNADPAQLLVTTQLIEAELLCMSSASKKSLGTAKVAVMMPSPLNIASTFVQADIQHAPVNGSHAEAPLAEPYKPEAKEEEKSNPVFDPLIEIPTLAHQQSVKELNDAISEQQHSLNDKLKEDVVELGHVLNGSPVRDLKKAIGVNDRYIFINELFRGDEVMYERSIKTINNFRNFQEAEYWIERELKIKLGWPDENLITSHFYQLVKRRFS